MGPTTVPRGRQPMVHLTLPMSHGRTPFNYVTPSRDTWQDLIGPHHRPHQHYCHLAACEWCTAVRRGAKWQHIEKPPQPCMPHDSSLLVHLTTVAPTIPQNDRQVSPTRVPRGSLLFSHMTSSCQYTVSYIQPNCHVSSSDSIIIT
jgi:hypothetical protein